MTAAFQSHDVHSAFQMVTSAISPSREESIPERKHWLAMQLLQLINADAYLWNSCSMGANGDIMATSVIEGGWPSALQRNGVFELITQPEFNLSIAALLGPIIQSKTPRLLRQVHILNEANREDIETRFASIGLVDVVLYLHPVSSTSFSGIGIYRFGDKVQFSDREHALIELVLNHVDWLHRGGIEEEVALASLELSPRERQVLLDLLSGDSKQQISASLQLSPHTIDDYIKSIYRKLNVNSRAELHALFHLGRARRM